MAWQAPNDPLRQGPEYISTALAAWIEGAGYGLSISSPASRIRTRPPNFRRTGREDWLGQLLPDAIDDVQDPAAPALDLRSGTVQQHPWRQYPTAETAARHRIPTSLLSVAAETGGVSLAGARRGERTSPGVTRSAFLQPALAVRDPGLDLRGRQIKGTTRLGHRLPALDDFHNQRRFPPRRSPLDLFAHRHAYRVSLPKVIPEQEINRALQTRLAGLGLEAAPPRPLSAGRSPDPRSRAPDRCVRPREGRLGRAQSTAPCRRGPSAACRESRRREKPCPGSRR